jgi:hypothetical protein
LRPARFDSTLSSIIDEEARVDDISYTDRLNAVELAARRPALRLEELERWLELVERLAAKPGHVGSTVADGGLFGRTTADADAEPGRR